MTLMRTGFLAITAAFMLAGPAMAGTKDDIRDLQARLAAAEQALAGQTQAMLRISQLERQIQDMTGEIEQLTYQLDQSNTRLDAVSAALAGDANYAAPGDFAGSPNSGPVSLMPGADSVEPTGDPIADQIARQTGSAANGGASVGFSACGGLSARQGCVHPLP